MESAYAHTWEPCSGITVKRMCSSSRRIHASFPSDDSDAVSSCHGHYWVFTSLDQTPCLLVKVLMF